MQSREVFDIFTIYYLQNYFLVFLFTNKKSTSTAILVLSVVDSIRQIKTLLLQVAAISIELQINVFIFANQTQCVSKTLLHFALLELTLNRQNNETCTFFNYDY